MDEEQKCELIDHTFFSRALAGGGVSCPTIVGEFVDHVQGQLMNPNLMDPPPQPSEETIGEWNGLKESRAAVRLGQEDSLPLSTEYIRGNVVHGVHHQSSRINYTQDSQPLKVVLLYRPTKV